jgi:hypothetical protein
MKRLLFALALLALAVSTAPIERAAAMGPALSAWYNNADGYLYLKGYGFTPGGTVHIDVHAYDAAGGLRNDHLITSATAAPWSGLVFWGTRVDYYDLSAGEFRIAAGPYGPRADGGCLVSFKIEAFDKSTGLTASSFFDVPDCGK